MLIQNNILHLGFRGLPRWTFDFADARGRTLESVRISSLPIHERTMPAYYFDMKDGVPIRGIVGLEFPTDQHAIEHSKLIAHRFSHEHLVKDRNLWLEVLSESGAEIHREPVYPDVK